MGNLNRRIVVTPLKKLQLQLQVKFIKGFADSIYNTLSILDTLGECKSPSPLRTYKQLCALSMLS
jgi:hypothetical protein